jgi:lipid II:glycine glycyltransferase (peptidoglycan interpeptide bridge formation enzyme)
MKDIRQSPQFANFMRDLSWDVKKIGSVNIYLKKFPLVGFFAKIPRIDPPIPFLQISEFIKKNRIFRVKIAPNILNIDKNYNFSREEFFKNGYKIENSPFNPTVDIHIDLTQKEEKLFNNFLSAKRRGVRKAIKNNVIVKETDTYGDFINIRKKQYNPLGFLLVNEMKKLWKNFYPHHARLLLSYNGEKAIGGILLLFYEKIAYYWYASALSEGKKLFAPTLLVWEALKMSKKRGCKLFVFEGIYDERFPKAAASWKGFTKFKEGFAGEKVIYLENFTN